ncbi:gamma-glutamyltransferase family protein [Limnochorda pilosa]|uniref:Gamma-glutamyltransferase n=1 Tax=Limnochorda pilosa TaxID=1555112 RepID=A0A0K2SHS9_LIMPI|nr:gamma-glutamyltransferase family protein [Limnochorda pilosa]BAS26661.1 gamma-glutamyltransferase [Limnochorda pilosa]
MQPFDYGSPFPSRRSPVMARHGMVATSHPLAVAAGLEVLREGGNAVDAAIATAAALTVVEPTSNGLGSDAFALVWDGTRLHGLNASGRSPRRLTAQLVREAGFSVMPIDGWLPVTVPGAVSGWVALSRRFGRLSFRRLFQPAIRFAEEGHPVPPLTARAWQFAERRFGAREDFRAAFLPGGRAPRAGELFRLPEQAETLRSIGESEGEAFYRGELASRMVAHAEAQGGLLAQEDLADHEPEWVEPLGMSRRGYRLWELPPNGQGVVALEALGLLDPLDLGSELLAGRRLHLLVEALRAAFADAYAHVADPTVTRVPASRLLEAGYLDERRRLLGEHRNPQIASGRPGTGDTVYLCTADAEGRMVSFIQSNYMGFGSGVVVPGTGIALQNRGAGFTLEEGHPNQVGPGKRPFHTIIPAFLSTEAGEPLAALGVMGGDMQPQGHLQVLLSLLDHRLDPQAALDAPRVHLLPDGRVALEPGIPAEAREDLARRGHTLAADMGLFGFGGGQIIWRDAGQGVYIAGSDPRKDGLAMGF